MTAWQASTQLGPYVLLNRWALRPFRGDTAVATLSSILKDDPPPLSAAPAIEPVVQRCLAKNPAARYQSMADVRAALQHAASPTDKKPSIAVLPFANMSGDAEQDYFSDGLAEEIINARNRTTRSRFRVLASRFVFTFGSKFGVQRSGFEASMCPGLPFTSVRTMNLELRTPNRT